MGRFDAYTFCVGDRVVAVHTKWKGCVRATDCNGKFFICVEMDPIDDVREAMFFAPNELTLDTSFHVSDVVRRKRLCTNRNSSVGTE